MVLGSRVRETIEQCRWWLRFSEVLSSIEFSERWSLKAPYKHERGDILGRDIGGPFFRTAEISKQIRIFLHNRLFILHFTFLKFFSSFDIALYHITDKLLFRWGWSGPASRTSRTVNIRCVALHWIPQQACPCFTLFLFFSSSLGFSTLLYKNLVNTGLCIQLEMKWGPRVEMELVNFDLSKTVYSIMNQGENRSEGIEEVVFRRAFEKNLKAGLYTS